MPSMGERFVCGGREFWCVGFDGKTGKAIMHSGAAVIQVPLNNFDKAFKKIGALVIGEQYTAKNSLDGIEAGVEYEVTAIKGENIMLSDGHRVSFSRFASLF